MKKKKILICFGVIYLLTCIYFFISYFDIFHTVPVVSFSKKLEATQNETVTNISYIKEIKYGKVISNEKRIDTSTLGEKKIAITIQNNYGKKRDYTFYINIIKKENNKN